MNTVTYVCVGSCMAEISKEQYDKGLTKCGAKDCTKYKEPFVELSGCECGSDCCMSQTATNS